MHVCCQENDELLDAEVAKNIDGKAPDKINRIGLSGKGV